MNERNLEGVNNFKKKKKANVEGTAHRQNHPFVRPGNRLEGKLRRMAVFLATNSSGHSNTMRTAWNLNPSSPLSYPIHPNFWRYSVSKLQQQEFTYIGGGGPPSRQIPYTPGWSRWNFQVTLLNLLSVKQFQQPCFPAHCTKHLYFNHPGYFKNLITKHMGSSIIPQTVFPLSVTNYIKRHISMCSTIVPNLLFFLN